MGVYSAQELNELATGVSAIEDWLRERCTVRHADSMADTILKAFHVIDDLADETGASDAGLCDECCARGCGCPCHERR